MWKAVLAVLLTLATCLGAVAPWGPVRAQDTLRIAAVVNDEVISVFDLFTRLQLALLISGLPDTPENRRRLAPQVLNRLIDERLQIQEASRLNISVTESEIAESIRNVETQNNMRPGEFDATLQRAGVRRDAAVAQFRADLLWVKVVRRRMTNQVSISEEDIDRVLTGLEESASRDQWRVQEIALAIDAPDQEPAVRAQAERLIEEIRGGASFSGLAQQFSQATSASSGGDLGWVSVGQLAPEVEAAISRMRISEVSPPIRTSNGITIVVLRERRQGQTVDPLTTRVTMRQLLLPLRSQAAESEVKSQADLAQIVTDTAQGCTDMERLADELKSPVPADAGRLMLRDMPAELRAAVADLPPGRASPPVRTGAGFVVVMVCDRERPNINLPSRDQVRQRLTGEQLELLARRYIRDLRFASAVEIRI